MLQSIHAFLHNILFLEFHLHYILQGCSTVLDSTYYSTTRITILILQCSCEQIYFQAFLFQNCIADSTCIQFLHEMHHVETTFYWENFNSSIFNRLLPDYIQSTCTQTTCSLHPLESTTQPQETFFLENLHILQEGIRTRILPTEV